MKRAAREVLGRAVRFGLSRAAQLRHQGRGVARSAAVKWGGLPHAEGTVDAPSTEVAGTLTGLWKANSISRASAVDPRGEAVVTMTTHGVRVQNAWVALESIAQGSVKPRRLILWLDERPARLPWRLRRLEARGVEILDAPKGLGVYTKFWPHIESSDPLELPLVLSDDDMIYPREWLAELLAAHRAHLDEAIAHRAHRIPVEEDADGAVRFGPYTSWQPVQSTEPSFHHFATSVSGQLLPPKLQQQLRGEGRRFLELAPKADDVWLHFVEVLHGWRIRQVGEQSKNYPFVPATQSVALNATNVFAGGNDRQLAACHSEVTRGRVAEDAKRLGT